MKAFNKNNFSIASLAISGPYEGLHITDDYTEVTNGHLLIRISSVETEKESLPIPPSGSLPNEDSIDIVIPCSSAKKIHDTIPKLRYNERLEIVWQGENSSKEYIEFLATDLEDWMPVISRKLSAQYPPTDKVFPEEKPQIETRVSVDYMKKMCEHLTKMGIKEFDLNFYGNSKVLEMEASTVEGQKVTILLMPRIRD